MKLISLNIEGDKHLDKIIKFLEKEKADVFCFSEIFEEDIKHIKPLVDMPYVFAHECYRSIVNWVFRTGTLEGISS